MPASPTNSNKSISPGPEHRRAMQMKHSSSSSVLGSVSTKSRRVMLSPAPVEARPITPQLEPQQNGPFVKHIVGDLFGTHSLGEERSLMGIMYHSRVMVGSREAEHSEKRHQNELERLEASKSAGLVMIDSNEDGSQSDNEALLGMNSRQQLAATLKNWSAMEENDDFVIHEGAVHALIALAALDDTGIRKCVAAALCNLSSRERNRLELINLGAASGAIIISTQVKKFKIAKMCAITLCYLSMQKGGEAILAKENAPFALVILLGVKAQRLLPICVQALFNLTCVDVHFKGMERIVKALINIPQTGFDHLYYFAKALANCSRYSWMRSRLIEDGSLSSLQAFMATIPSRSNKEEAIFIVATCLNSLSERPNSNLGARSDAVELQSRCRVDMISKGTMDLLCQLNLMALEHASSVVMGKSSLLLIKTVFNLLQVPKIPAPTLQTGLKIVVNIIQESSNSITLLYAAACIYIFTKEMGRFTHIRHTLRLMSSLPKLLESDGSPNGPLTLFYAITAAGNVFFGNISENSRGEFSDLVNRFVRCGAIVTDPLAIRTLSLAVARMVEESSYMLLFVRLQLLDHIIEMLLLLMKKRSDDMIVQESGVIAICRIALELEVLSPPLRQEIADAMSGLLRATDPNVVRNTVCSIRSLGEAGLCHRELLSDQFLTRVAEIAMEVQGDIALVRDCCAVFAVFSYDTEAHPGLAADKVMNVLFYTIRAEDRTTRELVATTLCNVSVNEEARDTMVERGVVEALANLSGATCESIQELCAKCICNLTASVQLHQKIIKKEGLQTILMIALVRSVATMTKQLCAKALLNLLCEENIKALSDVGALRVFAALSSINDHTTQAVCARGFLVSTGSDRRREDVCSRRAVLQALFAMVKCDSERTRVMVGIAICNLLACPKAQKTVIHAGGLAVLKIIATMDIDELSEATARTITSLVLVPALHDALLREPLVSVLVLFLQKECKETFDCALYALSSMSQYSSFRYTLIDKGCVSALVGAVITGRVNTKALAVEVCRCLCLLSFVADHSEVMVQQGNVLFGLHAIFRNGTCCQDAALMISIILRNLSYNRHVRRHIISQDAFRLLGLIMATYTEDTDVMCKAAIMIMHNLGLEPVLHKELISQGMMDMLDIITSRSIAHANAHAASASQHRASSPILLLQTALTPSSTGELRPNSKQGKQGSVTPLQSEKSAYEAISLFTRADTYYMAKSLHLVSNTESVHKDVVKSSAVAIMERLMHGPVNDVSRHEVACALCNLSQSKSCRELLVQQSAPALLVEIANSSMKANRMDTQTKCSNALGFLSEITKVDNGVVASFLLLSLNQEESADTRSHADANASSSSSQGPITGKTATAGVDLLSRPRTESPNGKSRLLESSLHDHHMGHGEHHHHGVKSLKQMIQDGVLRRSNVHGVRMEAIVTMKVKMADREHSKEAYDATAASGAVMSVEEEFMLKGEYADFTYTTIVSSALCETGGMAGRTSLNSLPPPGFGSDRVLAPPDRFQELVIIPIDETPLAKELTIPAEFVSTEAPDVTKEGEANAAAATSAQSSARNGNGKDSAGEKGTADRPLSSSNRRQTIKSNRNLLRDRPGRVVTVRTPTPDGVSSANSSLASTTGSLTRSRTMSPHFAQRLQGAVAGAGGGLGQSMFSSSPDLVHSSVNSSGEVVLKVHEKRVTKFQAPGGAWKTLSSKGVPAPSFNS